MWPEDTDPDPKPPNLDPRVQYLLKVSLQQSQLYQEMAHSLYATTQELLSLLQVAPAVVVSLPNPAQDTQCLLTKLTADDAVEVFLGTFERVATQDGWSPQDWSCALASLLTRQVQWAYYTLFDEDAEDYITLKEEVFAHCGLSSTRAASEFYHCAYQLGQEL